MMSPSIAQRLLDAKARLRRLDEALAELASNPLSRIPDVQIKGAA